MLKLRLLHLVFFALVLFAICPKPLAIPAYALNLENLKVYFLQGDYKSAIIEGEKILADAKHSSDLDELYYILALNYLKDGNYLRASDIFEIILREFRDSKFKEEVNLSLADTYFLRGDFAKAENYYRQLFNNNPRTKLKALIFYRLAQCGFKKGDTQQAKEYLSKLKNECPLNLESGFSNDISTDVYYTVQVGSFSNIKNANNLVQRLNRKGYPAYTEEVNFQGKVSYRARVGKFNSRQEAADLENKLSREGYPTKIYP